MNLHSILQNRQIIHSDPEIMNGVPVFVGTRVPLQTLFDYLDDEAGLSEFVTDYPYLKDPAIRVLEAIAQIMLSQQRNETSTPVLG
jgi:uncharacterized protein (DUF433 family)